MSILTVAYLGAGILFILSLGGLASQESARRGNWYGIIGMIIALAATMLHEEIGKYQIDAYGALAATIGIGSIIGFIVAKRVQMTAMPELVAILHSFVGLAAVLVGFSSFLAPLEQTTGIEHAIHNIEIYADIAIGSVTFTGSIIAWAKLKAWIFNWRVPSQTLLPGRHFLNLSLLIGIIVIAIPVISSHAVTDVMWGLSAQNWMIIMSILAGILGVHLVAAIGGGDMPVVVSLLNSYSGWTASAAGFMLGNDLLIITGALVGSSGAILSYIMCEAMNRSIWNVVFGGFGAVAPSGASQEVDGEMVEIPEEELVQELKDSKEIIIVPGYGMAVAQAQRAVDTFTRILRKNGKMFVLRFILLPVDFRVI